MALADLRGAAIGGSPVTLVDSSAFTVGHIALYSHQLAFSVHHANRIGQYWVILGDKVRQIDSKFSFHQVIKYLLYVEFEMPTLLSLTAYVPTLNARFTAC